MRRAGESGSAARDGNTAIGAGAFIRLSYETRWFAHYALHFDTVEINNTFYRLPEAATFENGASERLCTSCIRSRRAVSLPT